jgi:hypothetical protein
MSNGTIHSAAEITAAIDEIVEYLRTGDENRQALMHANHVHEPHAPASPNQVAGELGAT